MIAQMLPGFRDVRTPLITGYLWLTSAWILFGMPVPTGAETTGVLGSLNALTKFLSPAVSVIVLSFVAYVLGVLASPDSERFLRPGRIIVYIIELLATLLAKSWFRFILTPRMISRLAKESGSSNPSLSHSSEAALHGFVVTQIAKNRSSKDFRPLLGKYDCGDSLDSGFEKNLAQVLHIDVVEEALDPSAALLAADEKLYNNFDRTRSESEFRFCIMLPLLAIALASAWGVRETSWILSVGIILFGLLVSAGLVVRGWFKLHEATDIAVAAIIKGTIRTRALEQLDGLPEANGTKRGWARFLGQQPIRQPAISKATRDFPRPN